MNVSRKAAKPQRETSLSPQGFIVGWKQISKGGANEI
jgi:hypothetical protein